MATTGSATDGRGKAGASDRRVQFENVLVGVDGTASGRDAIALAAELRAPGGRLTLAHVLLAQVPIYRNFHATPAWDQTREMLSQERDSAGVEADMTGMFAPSVGGGLHQLAEDCGTDLLVVGSCSHSPVGRVLRGDAARATVRDARCPVAVAPHGYADRAKPIGVIGVAYDGSAEAKAALVAGHRLALDRGAQLRALTVVGRRLSHRASSTRDAGRAADDPLQSVAGAVEAGIARGPVDEQLVRFGDGLDLLVVGSRRHGPIRRLIFRSTALALTRNVRCPLLVIPPGTTVRSGIVSRPGS